MRKRLTRILLAVLCILMAASCFREGDLGILEYKLGKITPTGLRSAICVLEVNVRNKGPRIEITSGSGTLFANDRLIGSFKLDPVVIEGHDTQRVSARCQIRIDKDISLLDALQILRQSSPSTFNISYEADVKAGLFRKKLKEDKMPLSKFVK